MKKQYKLWLQVEEIVEEDDHWENYGEPLCLGTFDEPEEAENYAAMVQSAFE